MTLPAGRIKRINTRSVVFKRVVEPTFRDLEYGVDAAARWWLVPNRKTIVIDPNRSFGQPIAVENGVTTARLAQAVKAEGSIERVANIFEMKPSTIKDALSFEARRELSLAA